MKISMLAISILFFGFQIFATQNILGKYLGEYKLVQGDKDCEDTLSISLQPDNNNNLNELDVFNGYYELGRFPIGALGQGQFSGQNSGSKYVIEVNYNNESIMYKKSGYLRVSENTPAFVPFYLNFIITIQNDRQLFLGVKSMNAIHDLGFKNFNCAYVK